MNGISGTPPVDSRLMVPPDLYRPNVGIRDESVKPDGIVEPAWAEMFESCQRHGSGVLKDWRETAMRISRDRGLAYRPDWGEGGYWTLDPIPWIFSPEDWQGIEKGISQKLRLSAAILSDLYGEQKLLEKGLIPASIILSHDGFLRSLHNYSPGGSAIGLGMSAFDIARGTGGRTYILNDRFDCPFGLGVSLENRTVVNRVLPNLFRRCMVRRIGYFFSDWFDYLAERAPNHSENPRIVILDSSKGGESSEISFLANYCGITRVVASDLTVRSAKVWLKSLNGLKPVDVIWKTTHGRDLDPLEANRRSSAEGVSGIFEALRESNVAVAGHPGAEVLQSPGLFPFLAPVCRELLGEELILPPAATWWCGERKARQYVIDNLAKMVVKPVGHHSDFRTRYGQRLTKEELANLKAQIEAEPERYVGQEELKISTVPASTAGGLVPRIAVIRSFAFLDGKGEPHIMPGGLGRVSTAEGVIISTRESGESKDIWVRSHSADAPISIARRLEQSRVISPEVVPSRRGENLYWAGRYAERTDSICRFANRIVAGRSSGFSYGRDLETKHEKILMESLFRIFELDAWMEKIPDPDARLKLILGGQDCPLGVGPNLNNFHRACLAAREEWSVMSILAIESAREKWSNGTRELDSVYSYEMHLENLELNLAAFHGLNLDSMTRDEAWGLLDAGYRIERMSILTGLLVSILEVGAPEPMATLLNESVLFVSDSLGTYQSKFLTVPSTGLTLKLLLGEEDYPRSLRYLLERTETVLGKLRAPAKLPHPTERLAQMKGELGSFLSSVDLDAGSNPLSQQAAIGYLGSCRLQLKELHDYITTSYFSHAGIQG